MATPEAVELNVLAAKLALTQIGLWVVGGFALLGNIAQILSYFRRPKTMREELAEVDKTIRECLGDYVRTDALDKFTVNMNERINRLAAAAVRRSELESLNKRFDSTDENHSALAKEIREDLKILSAQIGRIEGWIEHDKKKPMGPRP